MSDGSVKNVEDMQVGDLVLAYNEKTSNTEASPVTRVHRPYEVKSYLIIDGRLKVTENHPILSGGEWVGTGSLTPGDWITDVDGLDALVGAVERVDEAAVVYNFAVELGTYIANGMIVHNKEDCEDLQQECIGCPGSP